MYVFASGVVDELGLKNSPYNETLLFMEVV